MTDVVIIAIIKRTNGGTYLYVPVSEHTDLLALFPKNSVCVTPNNKALSSHEEESSARAH